MSFLTMAKERYSCRQLSSEPVAKELLEKILQAADAAPTAVNHQPYHIWVLTGEENAQKIAQTTGFTFGAQTFLALGYDPKEAWVRPSDNRNFADIDAGIVGTHILMEIYDLGLGTTWVGHFDAPKLKKLYPDMAAYDLIALFPIGKPKPEAKPSSRHSERKGIEATSTWIK